MPMTLLSAFAQAVTTAAAEPGSLPCGPAADVSSLCLGVYRSTGNAVLAQLSDTLVVRPAKIAVILAGIEIPFAQRTIWHRGSDGAVAVLPRASEH